jgi:hypothetical protein
MIYPDVLADGASAPPLPTEREVPPGGVGIPAVNIHDGYAQPPLGYVVVNAIVPDPSTGSLYGSTVPMQDDPTIWLSAGDIPGCPAIVTQGSLLGDIAGAGAR